MPRPPRPPVGRRLWRRPKKATGTHASDVAVHDSPFDDVALDAALDEAQPPPAPAPRGFFARLFGKKPPPSPPPYLQEDPTAAILALPRGAARLDAFEHKLSELEPGSRDHTRTAIAFHRELTTLATEAGVDLSLYESRVQACAQALIAAGEDEKAGSLFSRIGRKHQAAELFVRAGAVDALEEIHAELAFDEGGPRLDARLAFERFEALFLVGRRDEALASLSRAVSLWENPIYTEVHNGFIARIPAHTLAFSAGADVVRVVPRFPVVLGRGEESAVRLDSPLVSRAHVEIERRAGALVLKDLVSSGGTILDGNALAGPTSLSSSGTINLAGIVVDYDVTDARLALRPQQRPREHTLAARGATLHDTALGCALRFAEHVRLVADAQVRLNGEPVRVDTLLLTGDRITAAGRTFVVTSG